MMADKMADGAPPPPQDGGGFARKARAFARHYFWQPHNKGDRILREKAAMEMDPNTPLWKRRLVRYRSVLALLLPALIVHIVWWPSMLLPENKLYLFDEYGFATATMVFGSIVAGMTSEGGAAVAFPVFTLAFSVPPTVARDFSFMIQSVGMTAASFSIFIMGVHVDWSALVYASLGGAAGIVVGLLYVAPAMDAVTKKLAFVSVWFAFAFSLFLLNLNHKRATFRNVPTYRWGSARMVTAMPTTSSEEERAATPEETGNGSDDANPPVGESNVTISVDDPKHGQQPPAAPLHARVLLARVPTLEPGGLQLGPAMALFFTGVFGGLNSAISGSGLDICSFAILTLLFRVTERTATPTSVVLMAGNTLLGFITRLASGTFTPEGPIQPLAWRLFAVAAPVVPLGAPLGTVLGARLHRLAIAALLYCLDTAQLIGAWVLLEPKMGPAQWGMSIGVIVVGALFFWLVTRAGARIIGASLLPPM